jgi:hypothetical protein
MLKARVVSRAARASGRRSRVELQDVVEGQIAEICRDLALEAKRMRQLQEQVDQLRTVIREWGAQSEAGSDHEPINRGGRR